MNDNVRLTFNISDEPILALEINLKTKASKVLEHVDNPVMFHAILQPKEWTYDGIQSRLQFWFNTQETLPEILDDIYPDGFYWNGQPNLDLIIEKL
ncbi:hypothetical protein [Lactobacillus sp. Sy-1]|uniref:hypothetical protein n=1 Tax=Lactobacillus sp. Sy-1 TaxID=2109645 RepID=UPI001C5AFB4C|nr:hypothetical protein [Lactobacillus sp. Sy-1]MBW1606090.1 hypothetical protein [Lactobacillus sp. Sy-1]